MSEPSPRVVLSYASIGHLFTHMMMLVYATIVLELETVFPLDYGELVSLAATGWLLFGLGALPSGWLADRWSATGMMGVFFVGLGLSTIATGFAQTPFQIALGLAAIGLFCAIYHPVGLPWLLRNSGQRQGLSIGVNGFFGAVGIAAAPLVAALCISIAGWRAAFFIPGALILATGVTFVILVHGDHARRTAPAQALAPINLNRATLRIFIALAAMAFSAGLIFHATSVAMPKLFEQGAGVLMASLTGDAADTGLLVSVIYLIAGGGQILVGSMADRMPKRPMFIAAYLLQLPILLSLGWLSGAPLVGLAMLAVCLSLGFQAVEDLLVVRAVPDAWISRVFAGRFVVAMGAGVLAPPLVGLGFDYAGHFGWVFVLLGALTIVVILGALALPRERFTLPAAATSVQPAE